MRPVRRTAFMLSFFCSLNGRVQGSCTLDGACFGCGVGVGILVRVSGLRLLLFVGMASDSVAFGGLGNDKNSTILVVSSK